MEQWNGTSWSIVASPNPGGSTDSRLNGVSCPSPTDCYAVGYAQIGPARDTLVEQYTGIGWSTVASPNTTATNTVLNGVSCAGTELCVAVGNASTEGAGVAGVVEQWSGTSWSIVASPNPGGSTNYSLSGVSCPSPTSCDAVGSYETDAATDATLIEQWSGASWSIVTSPEPSGSTDSGLSGISCPSTASCAAVGNQYRHASDYTLIERYDAKSAHATFDCNLRSEANGEYVSAELGYRGSQQGVLRARAGTDGPWEQFECVAVGINQWAIRSLANGRYVSTELGYPGTSYGVLRAHAGAIGSWETFTLDSVPGCSCFAIKGANSKFVSAELGYTGSVHGLLRARAATIGPWEKFDITPA